MRIISKFHDYYDIGLSYGVDLNMLYVRETKEIKLRSLSQTPYKAFKNIFDKIVVNINNVNVGVIGFCGKAYPFFTVSLHPSSQPNDFFYSYKSLKDFASKKNHNDDDITKTCKSKILDRLNRKGYYFSKKIVSVKEFDNNIVSSKMSDEPFISVSSPIILVKFCAYKDYTITINPMLRNYKFASQIDPYTAFQEIMMYLGSTLVKQVDPSVNFSDELKAGYCWF